VAALTMWFASVFMLFFLTLVLVKNYLEFERNSIAKKILLEAGLK